MNSHETHIKENFIDIPLETMITKLKTEDARNLQITKNFQWVYWVLIPIYTGLFILNPDKDLTLIDRISGSCLIVSFIIFALLFRKSVKEYKVIDYTLPTLEMMKQAAKRYHIWHPRLLWILLAVVIMDLGVTLSFVSRYSQYSVTSVILWVQFIYWVIIGVSFGIGLLTWRNRQKPIRDQANAIIKELIF